MIEGRTTAEANPDQVQEEVARESATIFDVVDRTVKAVRGIHVSIANLPLDALEHVKPLEVPVRQVKRAQEVIIGSVYDVICGINRQIAELGGQSPPHKP